MQATDRQIKLLAALASERPQWAQANELNGDAFTHMTKASASAWIAQAKALPREAQ